MHVYNIFISAHMNEKSLIWKYVIIIRLNMILTILMHEYQLHLKLIIIEVCTLCLYVNLSCGDNIRRGLSGSPGEHTCNKLICKHLLSDYSLCPDFREFRRSPEINLCTVILLGFTPTGFNLVHFNSVGIPH